SDDGQASDEEEFIHPSLSTHAEEETRDEESFNPIPRTPKNTDDEGNGEENLGINVGREEGHDEEEEEDELYRDVNINQGRGMESIFEMTSQMDLQTPTSVAAIPMYAPTITPSTIVTVKEQVKVQVSKILPKIKQTVNEQLEAEVLTRSSNSSKTSYAVAADLSEMELKKILIEKMEGNKSIHRSNEQRNLYKALVEAYESDKIILDTHGDTVTLKRRRDDDADKEEEPSAGSDRGSKRLREGKEPESASAPKKKVTKSAGKSTQGCKSQQTSASESATTEEPIQNTFKMEEPSHLEFDTGVDDQPIIESSQHPEWFSQQKKPPTLDRRRVIPFDHFFNNDLEYLRGGASSRKYTTSVTKTKAADYGHIKWIKDLESAHDVYSKRRIIAITKLKIVEWHNYKHLDWITVRRDDDKLYKFKEGDFKRLRIQDIEDMLLVLVKGKLTNLTVEERFAFNVSLRMFTRSIVIQRRVEDLQLGVESYQKKRNLTKPDTYRSDLKHKEAYIAYFNPRGFIYQNRLMRIDELHKFSNGTLTDVRTALDDRLKGIWMKYLSQSI
nr:hypothetical protein [Tanacetum cinerariifolium]